jgi:serine/threonine protein kinase
MAPEVIKGEIYTMKADIWSVGVVLYQMVFGKCPFESKSIAKLIKMLEDEDVSIPDFPKISPTLEKLLRKMLVKDYVNRIEWKELFEFTITETGEIYPPGVTPSSNPQFGLRNSIRSSSSFGTAPLSFNSSSNGQMYTAGQFSANSSTSTNNTSLSDSKGSPMLSPKVLKNDGKED